MDASLKERKPFVKIEVRHNGDLPEEREYYTVNKRSNFREFDEEIKRIALLADKTLVYHIIHNKNYWSVVEMSDYYEKLTDGEKVLVELKVELEFPTKTLNKEYERKREMDALCTAEPCCII